MKRSISSCFFCLAVLGLFFITTDVQAQPFPSHSIQVVIPGAPGDAIDIAGRLIIEELEKILKVPMVAVNKPGAGAAVGTAFAAAARKNGYTLLYSNAAGMVYSPAFSPETIPYDSRKDFEPLGMHVSFPDTLSVLADSPWKNFQDMVEFAKKNPGKFRCGTLGVGSISHFRLEIIKSLTGTDITMVPFKGAMPALTALLGGHVESAFVAVAISEAHYKSGKLRGILIDQKVAGLPEIPTLQQLGYNRVFPSTFYGFFAPAGIPEEVKNVLVPAIEKAAKNPDINVKLQNMWLIPNYKPPLELRHIIAEDYENARQMVKQMGVGK